VAEIRQELHGYVDAMPEKSLEAIRAFFRAFTEMFQTDEALVWETDLTEEEIAIIDAGERERAEHPESYTSLDDCIKEWEKLHKH
jgi:hypothetical protein